MQSISRPYEQSVKTADLHVLDTDIAKPIAADKQIAAVQGDRLLRLAVNSDNQTAVLPVGRFRSQNRRLGRRNRR